MAHHKVAIFGDNKLIFNNYEEFMQAGTANLAGQTLAFVNVEYQVYGTSIHQVNLITATIMTVGDGGVINLKDLVLASADPETLLKEQKKVVTDWIKSWLPPQAWTKTHHSVKRIIS